jgi:hypothetical protein
MEHSRFPLQQLQHMMMAIQAETYNEELFKKVSSFTNSVACECMAVIYFVTHSTTLTTQIVTN